MSVFEEGFLAYDHRLTSVAHLVARVDAFLFEDGQRPAGRVVILPSTDFVVEGETTTASLDQTCQKVTATRPEWPFPLTRPDR